MKVLSTAEAAQRTLAALASKGLPPTVPNYLAQFREIAGEPLPAPGSGAETGQAEHILFLMGTLMDAVKQASTSLQDDLALFGSQSREFIAQAAVHTDPDAANEMFHALSASASWLLGQVGVTRRELSNTKAQLAAVSHELNRARDQAITDALTGLPNRRGFDFALNHELARARRNKLPLSVVMFDLDHFKAVNDAHGHAVGDAVLCHVAALIKSRLRTSDVFARYGGEEFAALLPETHGEGAEIVVARLLDTIKRTPAESAGQSISITASAGVTQWLPGEDPQVLIERADQALYSAKRAGRDRVVCAVIPQLPGH